MKMLTVKQAKALAGVTTRRQFFKTAMAVKLYQELAVYNLRPNHYFITEITRDGSLWYLGSIETETKKGILIHTPPPPPPPMSYVGWVLISQKSYCGYFII